MRDTATVARTEPSRALRFDRTEWAGAFGDLGTLIPFVIAYTTLGSIDPIGVFLGFGIALCVTGAYYRTPFPVQPMKAIGAAIMLALPQVPLTLGNAIIAVTDENNRLFPQRAVTEKQVAISTGLMNIGSSAIGGVPMCHGAGGMAGHVRFGATTGGAPIILGAVLIVLALFFGSSIETVLRVFPQALLGVILFLAGAQLALGSCDFSKDKGERFATLVTAAFAIWNVGAAFVAGAAVFHALKHRWMRL